MFGTAGTNKNEKERSTKKGIIQKPPTTSKGTSPLKPFSSLVEAHPTAIVIDERSDESMEEKGEEVGFKYGARYMDSDNAQQKPMTTGEDVARAVDELFEM